MTSKQWVFDNEKVTNLLKEYYVTESEYLLSQIINESTKLIRVIAGSVAGRWNNDDDVYDDLRQEGFEACLNCIMYKKYDFESGSKLYSFLSIVIRNAMIDFLRKQRPVEELDESYSFEVNENDEEYVELVMYNLIPWFEQRFPEIIPKGYHQPVLQELLDSMVDLSSGKSRTITRIAKDYELNRKDVKIAYDALVVKLRMLMIGAVSYKRDTPEDTLYPELLELFGQEDYNKVREVFKGLSIMFRKDDN